MRWEVALAREAVKALQRMDRATEERVVRRLEQLAVDPFDPRLSQPLRGLPDLRSSRVGSWRVLYTVREDAKLILVVAIRPRDAAYR